MERYPVSICTAYQHGYDMRSCTQYLASAVVVNERHKDLYTYSLFSSEHYSTKRKQYGSNYWHSCRRRCCLGSYRGFAAAWIWGCWGHCGLHCCKYTGSCRGCGRPVCDPTERTNRNSCWRDSGDCTLNMDT